MGVMQPLEQAGRLVITPNPIILDGQQNIPVGLRDGESLRELITRNVDIGDRWEVAVEGEFIPASEWATYYPKPGQTVEIRGAVGKSVLYLVAMVALTYFTMGTGAAWIAGTFGVAAGGLAASMIGAGLFLAGSMLINKALGPKPPSLGGPGKQPDQTFSLTSQRNTFRAHEPVPLLFGGPLKITPDLASDQPYQFFRGDDQYLALTLNCGINVDRVEALYNGDTPLSDFEGVSTYHAGFAGMPEQAIPLYSNTDTIAGGVLDANVWVARTSGLGVIRLRVDLEYNIYDFDSKGRPRWNQETVEVQYRAVGSGTWLTFGGAVLRGSKPGLKRRSIEQAVAEGQYEVQVRRKGLDTDGSGAHCEVSWSTLTSVQADTTNYKGLSRIGVSAKATGQLNGSLDQLRTVAYACDLPYWTGSAWVTDGTQINNPGAQILQYARGYYDEDGVLIGGMGLPDSMIDIEALKAFILHNIANGYTYTYYLKDARSHEEVLNSIALAGFGQISWATGKLSVVWAAQDQPLGGVVNMATIKRGQFQVDYTLAGGADGIEFTYLDASDWTNKTLRVSAPGVATPLNPARIAGEGITSEAHAAEMARYHLAQHLYQYKSIQYGTNLQHLSYRRLSVLALQHDLTQWGKGGRVQAAETGAEYLGPEIVTDLLGQAAASGVTKSLTTEGWLSGVSLDGSSDRLEWRLYNLTTTAIGEEYEITVVAKRGAQGTTQRILAANHMDGVPNTDIASTAQTYAFRVTVTGAQPIFRVYAAGAGAVGDEVIVQSISIRKVMTDGVTLTLDEPVPPPSAENAYIGLRIPGEDVYRVFPVQPFAEETRTITIAEEWPDGVMLPGDSDDNPAHDTIWIYDFKQTPGYKVRVVGIDPESGLKGATVNVVPESDEFWEYVKTGSYLPAPANTMPSVRPVASNVTVAEATTVQGNTTYTELAVAFDIAGNMDRALIFAQYTSPDGDVGEMREVAQTLTRSATFRIDAEGTYDILVRPYNVDGIAGGTGTASYDTTATGIPPVNFDTFTVTEVDGGSRRYAWGYNPTTIQPADLGGAEIRYTAQTASPVWDDMTPLVEGAVQELTLESALPLAGDWTFAIRARNTSGLLSTSILTINATLGNSIGQTIASTSSAADDAMSAASAAMTAAQAAQATADGTITTYYQATAPWPNGSLDHANDAGDMWYVDSGPEEGQAYRWNEATKHWDLIQDSAIAVALAAAQNAQTTADGKITSFYSDTAPTSGMEVGDLWYDTNDKNKPHYWSGSAWVSLRDGTISDAQQAANDAAAAASSAATAADLANAALDKISADGWLTGVEKKLLVREHEAIVQMIGSIQASADAFGVSRTAHDTAKAQLTLYLGALSPAWDNTGSPTAIDRDEFDGKFTTYYAARQALLDAIAAKAKELADDAQADATNAKNKTDAGLDADGRVKSGLNDLDRIGDGTTYGRPIKARLNAGKPWIDFTETIHTGKSADNIPESAGRKWALESGATVGAKAGVNLKRASGTVLADADIITSQGTSADTTNVAGTAAATVKANAAAGKLADDDLAALATAGDVNRTTKRILGFQGKGALASKSNVDLGTTDVIGKTADAIPESATRKYAAESGATVGATWGTNVAGRPAELTDGRITLAIDGPTGKIKTGWAIARKVAGVDFDGTADIAVPLGNLTGRTADKITYTVGGLTIDALKPAEAGAEVTTGKPLTVLTGRTADNITESTTRKWAAQSGATVGATWGTNLGGRPVELTDGRIAAGLAATGDVARDVPPARVKYTGGATLDSLKPAESGAEVTTGKSLAVLTARTADNIAESATRKYAAESGADVTSLASGAMVSNPSFEQGTKDWALEAQWALEGLAGSAFRGTYGLVRTGSAVIPNSASYNTGKLTAVKPGQRVKLGAAMRAQGANGACFLALGCFDAAGGFVAIVGATSITGTVAYGVVEGIAEVPAGTSLVCACVYASGHTAGYYYADCFNATIMPGNQDEVPDGPTYARTLGTELTAGVHKLGIAGSGKRVGDQRNLPQSLTSAYGSVNSATALVASSVGTVSVNAHTAYMGGSSAAYSAVSPAVSGLTQNNSYVIYCIDPAYAGGVQTWFAAATVQAAMQAGDGVHVAGIITIPPSGTTNDGGNGNVPPTQYCVDWGTVLPDGRLVREMVPGVDGAWCVNVATGEREFVILRGMAFGEEACYLLASASSAIIQSTSTPMDLPDGRIVRTPDMRGELVLPWAGGTEPVTTLIPVGTRRVCKPDFGNRMFYAGIAPDACLATHNIQFK